MDKEYMNEMGYCPICKDTTLDYCSIELCGDNMAYFPYTCRKCGVQGEECYSLSFEGHNIYDEEGNVIEVEEV